MMRVSDQHALLLYDPEKERFVEQARELEHGKSYYLTYPEKDTFARLQKTSLAMYRSSERYEEGKSCR